MYFGVSVTPRHVILFPEDLVLDFVRDLLADLVPDLVVDFLPADERLEDGDRRGDAAPWPER